MVFIICCTLFCYKTIQKLRFKITFLIEIIKDLRVKGEGVCITASGNILARVNISLKLFMTALETIEQ